MRSLYVLIGVLLGVIVTTHRSFIVLEALEQKWDKEALVFTLTGMSEGWSRGRDFTERKYQYFLQDMQTELTTCRSSKLILHMTPVKGHK